MANNWLAAKKAEVLPRWAQAACGVYPDGAAMFLSRDRGEFANPVGNSLLRGLEELYDGLIRGVAAAELEAALDRIIRVRAVQEMSPAQAVAFIFQLKRLLREAGTKGEPQPNWPAVDAAIDDLALQAFAVYSACREQLYQIRLAQVKKRCQLFERMQSKAASE